MSDLQKRRLHLTGGSTVDVELRNPNAFEADLAARRLGADWLIDADGVLVRADAIVAVTQVPGATMITFSTATDETHVWTAAEMARRLAAAAVGASARSGARRGGGGPPGVAPAARGGGTAGGGSLSGCTGWVFPQRCSCGPRDACSDCPHKITQAPPERRGRPIRVVVASNREQATIYLREQGLPAGGPDAPLVVSPHDRGRADGLRLEAAETVLLPGWDRDERVARSVRFALAKRGHKPADCRPPFAPARGYYLAPSEFREEIWAQGIPPTSVRARRGVRVEPTVDRAVRDRRELEQESGPWDIWSIALAGLDVRYDEGGWFIASGGVTSERFARIGR